MYFVDLLSVLGVMALFLGYDVAKFPAVLIISWLMFAWHYTEKKLNENQGVEFDLYPGVSIFPHLGFSLVVLFSCTENAVSYLFEQELGNLLQHRALFFQVLGILCFSIGMICRYLSLKKKEFGYNIHQLMNYWGFYLITIGMAFVLLSFYSLLAVQLFVLPALFMQDKKF